MGKGFTIECKDRKDKMELEPITHLPHPHTTNKRLWNDVRHLEFIWCEYGLIWTWSWLMLIFSLCPHFFHSFFCSASLISTTLTSSSLIHSSVSFHLLLIPSSVFFISTTVFCISSWFLFIFSVCYKSLTSHFVHPFLAHVLWSSSQSLP